MFREFYGQPLNFVKNFFRNVYTGGMTSENDASSLTWILREEIPEKVRLQLLLATRVRAIMRDLDLATADDLAAVTSLKRGTIRNVIGTEESPLAKHIPNAYTVSKLAEKLGVSADYLLGLTSDPTAYGRITE